jgi:hypothetical protein
VGLQKGHGVSEFVRTLHGGATSDGGGLMARMRRLVAALLVLGLAPHLRSSSSLAADASSARTAGSQGACIARTLRLRGAGGAEAGGEDGPLRAEEERKRRAAAADGPDSKRPRVAARGSKGGGSDAGARERGAGGADGKALVRIPRELLKKLRAVVKEVPPEGMPVAKFADRFQQLHGESLKATASSLGFGKVTALLSVLPAICNCTLPPMPPAVLAPAGVQEGAVGSSASADREDASAAPRMKRVYAPIPGAAKAARTAARKQLEKELWQEVDVSLDRMGTLAPGVAARLSRPPKRSLASRVCTACRSLPLPKPSKLTPTRCWQRNAGASCKG